MAKCYCHKIDYNYQSTFALYELYFINHHYFCNIQMYTSANYCILIISCKQLWVSKLWCDPKIPIAEKISKRSECKKFRFIITNQHTKTSVRISTRNFTPLSRRPTWMKSHEYCGVRTFLSRSSAFIIWRLLPSSSCFCCCNKLPHIKYPTLVQNNVE
jgi:hypothetical protein